MKKYIISCVCAMSTMILSAVQMPAQYYRPANLGVVYSATTPTQKGEYRPNGQINSREFVSHSHVVTTHATRFNEYPQTPYFPAAMEIGGQAVGMMLEVSSADSRLNSIGAYDCEDNGAYAPGAASPIRRAVGIDGTGEPDEKWKYNGTWYGRDSDGTLYVFYNGWIKMSGVNPGEIGYGYSPIGSPILPFLLFAMMACGVIYYRRRKVARA